MSKKAGSSQMALRDAITQTLNSALDEASKEAGKETPEGDAYVTNWVLVVQQTDLSDGSQLATRIAMDPNASYVTKGLLHTALYEDWE